MAKKLKTWNVFEAELKTREGDGYLKRDLKIFLTKKGYACLVEYDAKQKKILRFAIHSNVPKDNQAILEITTWINQKAKTKEITWPGQMIENPDLTQPAPYRTAA
jgi:hypothetical protein